MKFAKYWEHIELENPRPESAPSFSVCGASNDSPAAAGIHAQNRLQKFRQLLESGFSRRDEYEYGAGFIREQVLEEIMDHDAVLAVLSRNHYGAVILNTTQVVFGDIDIPRPSLLEKIGLRKKGKAYFVKKIKTYQQRHPELAIRVYETFSGLRFILTHATSQPDDVFVRRLFSELEVDPLYADLCHRQACFRARLTPKPWRIGLERPAGRFPRTKKSDIEAFDLWLRQYDLASSDWAAARLLEAFGPLSAEPQICRIIDLHDRQACRSDRRLA